MRHFSLVLAGLGLLALAASARAETPFAAVPALDGKKTTLQIRQVEFSGGASGNIIVEVRNPAKQAQLFQAKGLYFVPHGDAQNAPQREGAVGPFEIKEGQTWRHAEQMMVPAGKTVTLRLQTFCLDSHRGAPGKGQGFGIAKTRLPKELMNQNEAAATRAIRAKAGKVDAAQSEIQSNVWSNRNKKWIKLEGERANEKASSPVPQGIRHYNRRPIQQNQSIE